MSKSPLLVLDSHYLCHRAFHVTQGLSWEGKATGVVFHFLKTITSLKNEFLTDRIAFCFEHPHLFRREIYPSYKMRRKERTAREEAGRTQLAIQISELRKRYLPEIGFKNIFCFRGFESDDIMASIALNCPPDEEVILVTSDSDLYQCLDQKVSIYTPQKQMILSLRWFVKKYGIFPKRWAQVKAMAGCSTDEVQGIKGVGELTALAYLKGELGEHTRAYKAIISLDSQALVRRNRELVCLPFKGCPVPCIQDDEANDRTWRKVCLSLGMRTIATRRSR